MLHSLLRNALPKEIYITGFKQLLHQPLRSVSSNFDVDQHDALKIEGSLFENSKQQHNPVGSSDEFLRQQIVDSCTQQKKSLQKKALVKKEHKIIYDPELGLEFYRGNKLLNPFLTAVRSQKQRDKKRKIVVEGRRLISEAINCNLHMDALIFSQKDQLLTIKDEIANAQRAYGSRIFKVSQHELKMWSTLTTPPGMLAVFERPLDIKISEEIVTTPPLPITVVCDNIREPSNLGSIIRTCAALPCVQVIVTKGCCDPWQSKALRGGCGGHFRLLIRDDVCWSDLENWIPSDSRDDYTVFIAENNVNKALKETEGKATNYQDISVMGGHNILIIGGESYGVSAEAYKFLETNRKGKCLFIPLANGIDSLNAASALTLILYELRSKINKLQSEDVKS